MTERRAYLLLLVVILIWASHFPLSKLALREIGPATLAGARSILAVALLYILAIRTAPLDRPLVRRDYVAFAVLGLTGLVGNSMLWYWGLSSTTALNAGILGAAAPISVAVAAAWLLGDTLKPRNWLGVVLTVVAVVITVSKGSLDVLLSLSFHRGDLLILASQTAWVAYSLYSRATASNLSPIWIMVGAHVVGSLALVPLALIFEAPWHDLHRAGIAWAVILYGAGLMTLSNLWYYVVIRTIGAGRAGAFMNLMPFVVLALAWLIVGESIHPYHLVGITLVITGVYLTTR